MMNNNSQSLDMDVLYELDKFQKGSVKKRLTNELVEFSKLGAYIHAEFSENTNNNNSSVVITIVLKGENNVYHFEVTHNYPFTPPKIFRINYKNYKQYLNIDSPKTLQELKLYKGINCLCCHTISCGDNWGPMMRLKNFIDEYKTLKQFRRDIINRILAQKIIDKYLYPDANLLEWLI